MRVKLLRNWQQVIWGKWWAGMHIVGSARQVGPGWCRLFMRISEGLFRLVTTSSYRGSVWALQLSEGSALGHGMVK